MVSHIWLATVADTYRLMRYLVIEWTSCKRTESVCACAQKHPNSKDVRHAMLSEWFIIAQVPTMRLFQLLCKILDWLLFAYLLARNELQSCVNPSWTV